MWVKNPLSLVKKDDVDIIIELIGGPDGIAIPTTSVPFSTCGIDRS